MTISFDASCLTHADSNVQAILTWACCNDWLDCSFADDIRVACNADATEMLREYEDTTDTYYGVTTLYNLTMHMIAHCTMYRAADVKGVLHTLSSSDSMVAWQAAGA